MKTLKHILTDGDGERFYVNDRGDLVDKRGKLLPLAEEFAVRQLLRNAVRFSQFTEQQDETIGQGSRIEADEN